MYQDEKLICEDCGCEFVFTAGEKEFYAQKGLVNTPKRCFSNLPLNDMKMIFS